jgi:glycosyltransferase involved in cell wall biosynthesis
MASVIRILAEQRVGADVVVTHPTWRPDSPVQTLRLAASAALGLMRIGPGAVAHVHLSEGGAFVREGSLVRLARRRGLGVVVTMHGADYLPFARQHPRLATGVLSAAHVTTCLDEELLEWVRENAPSTHAVLLPNPVPVQAGFTSAAETPEVVLFAGEVGRRKGADVLCRAWESVAASRPEARCLLVGPPGDFEPPAMERLEVRGAATPEAVGELMRGARVIALPSRAEGMPMTLTEALGLGRPFVSTPVGGIPELAESGGLLVDVDDVDELAGRLTELLADRGLAGRIGAAGRDFCVRTRSVEVVGERLRGLYEEALAG